MILTALPHRVGQTIVLVLGEPFALSGSSLRFVFLFVDVLAGVRDDDVSS